MKYDAFISYRHTKMDLEVAKKLHKALETYHIPKSVQKKTGKKKINRVFRDQEELPIGSDLNDNISSALREAEYLIVICSPDTPDSYWVSKEINTFIEMHDREHVLAVLISGEPWESFPKQLLTDSQGNAVEPLAADIRGENQKDRDRKFKTEFLRLAAPLIGCTYDDLKQRHKERIIKRNLTIGLSCAAAVAVFGALFGAYNAVMASRMKKLAEEKAALAEERTRLAGEIFQELRDKQINQSKYYAAKSEALLDQGLREDACMVAMEGLPKEGDERPLVSRSQYALSNALYTYGTTNLYSFNRYLAHENIVNDALVNESAKRLTSIDSTGYVYVWDTSDWKQLAVIPVSIDDDDQFDQVLTANADEENVYIITNSYLKQYDFEGNLLKTFKTDFSIRGGDWYMAGKEAVLVTSDTAYQIDLTSFKELHSVKHESGFGFETTLSQDGKFCMIEDSSSSDTISLAFWNIEEGTLTETGLPDNFCSKMMSGENGSFILLSNSYERITEIGDYRISVFSPDGSKMWEANLPLENVSSAAFRINVRTRSYTDAGTEKNELVISAGCDVFVYDINTGELLGQSTYQDAVLAILLSSVNSYGYVVLSGGQFEWADLYSGTINPYSEIQTGLAIKSAMAVSGNILVLPRNSVNLFIMSQVNADLGTELTELTGEGSFSVVESAPDFSCYILRTLAPVGVDDTYSFYDFDGNLLHELSLPRTPKKIAYLDDECLLITSDGVYYVNPSKHTDEFTPWTDFGGEELGYGNITTRNNSDYAAVFDSTSLAVVNLRTKESVILPKQSAPVRNATLSLDGKTLYYTLLGSNLSVMDLATGSVKESSVPDLICYPVMNHGNDIAVTGDDHYLALHCADDMIRIVDLTNDTLYDSFPLTASNEFFFTFTNNNDTLLMQRDNCEIVNWSMTEKQVVDITECTSPIIQVAEDSATSRTIITTSNNLLVIGNEDNGILCKVPRGISFSPAKNEFIILTNSTLRSIPFKNYEEMIEDFHTQFPDAYLNAEKKARYNIDTFDSEDTFDTEDTADLEDSFDSEDA